MTQTSGLAGISPRQWLILLMVQLATLLNGMTITLANVVLPQIKGAMAASARRRIVTVATEHSCVLETARWLERQGHPLDIVGVGADGLVDLDALARALGDDVALVSVMLVNNEIGVIQPLAEIAALAHAAGALVHCDAAQGFGKMSLSLDADLVSVTAHKMYGPKGVGALIVRPGVAIEPQMHGGGQEAKGLRSGTLPVPLVAGFGAAAALAAERMDADAAHCERLWGVVLAAIDVPHNINGSTARRWRGNLNIRFDGIDGDRLLADLKGLSVSSGAACASAVGRASHVLEAIGLTRREAKASLRIGWGRFTTEDEVRTAASMINTAVRDQRKHAA